MSGKKAFCLWILIAVLAFAPVQHAHAAELNVYLHIYTVDGVAVGEISLGDQVAFRLRVAKDGALPVISMHKGNAGTVIAPDIINGMFVLRFTGAGAQ